MLTRGVYSFTGTGCTASPEKGVQFQRNGVYSFIRNLQFILRYKNLRTFAQITYSYS